MSVTVSYTRIASISYTRIASSGMWRAFCDVWGEYLNVFAVSRELAQHAIELKISETVRRRVYHG